MSNTEIDRRQFLQFMGQGAGAAAVALTPLGMGTLLSACASEPRTSTSKWKPAATPPIGLRPLSPSNEDRFALADGFEFHRLLTWGDRINKKGDRFGINNDFIALIEESPTSGVLWVNHEYPSPMVQHQRDATGENTTRAEVEVERESVGGTLVRVKRSKASALWELDIGAPLNRRFSAKTAIPFAWHEPIAGAKEAIGTMGNCAGGLTPWGTFLSCEENIQDYFPEGDELCYFGWHRYWTPPREHYGWVVEIDSKTGAARKLVSLGRMRHEAATVVIAADGRPVVYMGEDKIDSFLFKFIGDRAGSLETGKLYTADLKKGRWLEMHVDAQPVLKKRFGSQTQVLIHAIEAAELLGATPLDRPEDIEINPVNGDVLVACTNNKKAGRPHGSILRLREAGGKCEAKEFDSALFLPGGEASGITCPDNMAFDPRGGLWVTNDVSGRAMHRPPYTAFGNNSLFYIPMAGDSAGLPHRVANAPVGSEVTGPWFQKDGRLLFVSVQHPGEDSEHFSAMQSHWPLGGTEIPRSAVIQITGPGLDALAGK